MKIAKDQLFHQSTTIYPILDQFLAKATQPLWREIQNWAGSFTSSKFSPIVFYFASLTHASIFNLQKKAA
jgi:hypothetical protein